MGQARAPGAVHIKKIYTPIVKVFKKDLSKNVVDMLNKEAAITSQGGRITVKALKTCFLFVGGDNLAEALNEKVKSKQRRAGTLRTFSDDMQGIETLHAAALLRNPTMKMALESLAEYRCHLAKSADPAQAFEGETIKRWLK